MASIGIEQSDLVLLIPGWEVDDIDVPLEDWHMDDTLTQLSSHLDELELGEVLQEGTLQQVLARA